MPDLVTVGILLAIVVLFLFSAFKVLNEYERGVIFQLGRFHGVKGPGLIILIPVVQRWCASICARS